MKLEASEDKNKQYPTKSSGSARRPIGSRFKKFLYTSELTSNIHSVNSLRNTVGRIELMLIPYYADKSHTIEATIRSAPPLDVQ